jgi:hypothetical protein
MIPRVKRGFGSGRERLVALVWGGVGVVVLVAAVVLLLAAGDDPDRVEGDGEGIIATAVDRLGERGTADGEGLTRIELRATPGVADVGDGGASVPTGTVDGPGRWLFGGVTVRMPGGEGAYQLRQVVPEDIPAASVEGAFVRWAGWVSVVRARVRRGETVELPQRLAWTKAENAGVTVPAGAEVRLRTLFRLPDSAGRCVGATVAEGRSGHRARENLRRAPAWMIRRVGPGNSWEWLRASVPGTPGLFLAVRSGPTRQAVFRGSRQCAVPQPSVSVDPDPSIASESQTGQRTVRLPLDPPDGF